MSDEKKSTQTHRSQESSPKALTRGEADPGDGIAGNRVAIYVPAAAVPAVPAGYQPVDVTVRRQRLSWVQVESQSELKDALRELSANAPNIREDLGDLAPDVSVCSAQLARIEGIQASITAQQATLDAHLQLLEIALSDSHDVVVKVHGEYDHRVGRIPAIAPRYTKVVTYATSHSRAISAGIAQKNAADTRVTAAEEAARAAALLEAEGAAAAKTDGTNAVAQTAVVPAAPAKKTGKKSKA